MSAAAVSTGVDGISAGVRAGLDVLGTRDAADFDANRRHEMILLRFDAEANGV